MEVGVHQKSIMPTPEEITDTVTQVANVIPTVAKKVTPDVVKPMIHAITDPIQQAAQAIPGIARSISPQQTNRSIPRPVQHPAMQAPPMPQQTGSTPASQPRSAAGAPPENLPI